MQTDMEEISPHEPAGHPKNHSLSLYAEDYSIEQFLNREAFVEYKYDKQPLNQQENMEKGENCGYESDHKEHDETSKKTKRKSIFHNFQKHLITLLKKHFRIGVKTFEGREECQLAFALWHAFSKTKSYNKKILHIIFGIQENTQIQNQYDALAYEFKEFRTIKNKHNLLAIMRAQDLIRAEVVSQSRAVNRLLLEANCNVSRLELFWQYFNSFIVELREGPMVKRMTKEQKGRLIQKYAASNKEN